jgi:hypothetical protein
MRIPQSSCLWKLKKELLVFSYRFVLGPSSPPFECNREYCISLTLIRFVTAMVLHSFVYHVCVN